VADQQHARNHEITTQIEQTVINLPRFRPFPVTGDLKY